MTNAAGRELASFVYPSVYDSRTQARKPNDGRTPLEPPMRVSQVVLEPTLRDLLIARAEHVGVQYGWTLETFAQDAVGVTAELVSSETGERRTIRAKYLVGCDGAGSRTRRELGIGIDEIDLRRLVIKELGVRRVASNLVRSFRAFGQRPPDGRFHLVHFATALRRVVQRFGQMWHLQSPEGWSVNSQDDGDIWTLHGPVGDGRGRRQSRPKRVRLQALRVQVRHAGARLERVDAASGGCRLVRSQTSVAGRDAVHQVTRPVVAA